MAYTVVNGKLVKKKKKHEYGYVPLDLKVPRSRHNYDEPDPKTFPKDKGMYKGACNRKHCLRYPATWYNRGSYAFYCQDCGLMLNNDNRHDEFCKDEPLCYVVTSKEEASKLHCSPHR